ncbi:unnamed protein product, partial [Mesocestoides corti]
GPQWIPTDIWDRCNPECGPGTQRKVFSCVQNDRYNTTVLRPERFCGPLPQTFPPEAIRQCDWGDCSKKTWWRTSNWSICSQPCGDHGFTTREVECVMGGDEGEIVISQKFEDPFCDPKKRPESHGVCNRFNCPAEFLALEWQKCEQKDPCKSGFQTRQLSCRSLHTNGTYVELPKIACYMGRKPPPSTWRRCFIPEVSAMCTQKDPVIDEVKMVVVQMRAVRKMSLQVGQEAYILPTTRLSIKCPVKFFPGSSLVWRHKVLGNFTYTGDARNTTNSRFVSKSGHLVIRRFSGADAGEWRCFAGNEGTSAAITLHYNLPSQGLADWAARTPKRNIETQNEDPAVVMTRQKLVQWIEGPWSNCSVPCGGQGIQTRVVRCELLDTGVYHVLEDSECERQFLVKPKTQRVCTNLPKCPTWQLRNADYSKVTVCISCNSALS